jgi:hypothetical protein
VLMPRSVTRLGWGSGGIKAAFNRHEGDAG